MVEQCTFTEDFVKSNEITYVSTLNKGDTFHPLFGCETVILTKEQLQALLKGCGILVEVESEYTIVLTCDIK